MAEYAEAQGKLFVNEALPVAFCFHRSVKNPGTRKALSDLIKMWGGRVTDTDNGADVVLVDEGRLILPGGGDINTLREQYRSNVATQRTHVEHITFIRSCISHRVYEHKSHPRHIQREALSKLTVREKFTDEDDDNLVHYLATKTPNKVSNRLGNKVYQDLVQFWRESVEFNWVRRHSWQSWRERYKKKESYFDRRIVKYLREVSPNMQSVYSYTSRRKLLPLDREEEEGPLITTGMSNPESKKRNHLHIDDGNLYSNPARNPFGSKADGGQAASRSSNSDTGAASQNASTSVRTIGSSYGLSQVIFLDLQKMQKTVSTPLDVITGTRRNIHSNSHSTNLPVPHTISPGIHGQHLSGARVLAVSTETQEQAKQLTQVLFNPVSEASKEREQGEKSSVTSMEAELGLARTSTIGQMPAQVVALVQTSVLNANDSDDDNELFALLAKSRK